MEDQQHTLVFPPKRPVRRKKTMRKYAKQNFARMTQFTEIFCVGGGTVRRHAEAGRINCETDPFGSKWYKIADGITVGLPLRKEGYTRLFPQIADKQVVTPPVVTEPKRSEVVSDEVISDLNKRIDKLVVENETLQFQVEYLEKSLSVWKERG